MKKTTKILASVLAAVMCAGTIFMAACTGADGKDGKDLDIYDVYSAVNQERVEQGLEELSFLDFIEEYFDYVTDQAVASADESAVMNHSLMSGVSIYTQFTTSSSYFSKSYDVFVGSGVFIDVDKEAGDAYIVTNAHVVYDSAYSSNDGYSEEVYLYLYGSDTYGIDFNFTNSGSIVNVSGIEPGYTEVIGVSLSYDIAVLKVTGSEVIKNSDVCAASFCTDTDIYVGDKVYTVGNPSYEGLSVMQGIISRDSETIEVDVDEDSVYDSYGNLVSADYESFRVFRTTAAINGGNSGGAVYNMSGEIIGIANATSLTEDNLVQDMCYALPANNVRRIAQSFIDNYEKNSAPVHYLSKALLGITTSVDAESTYAEYDADTGRTVISEKVVVYSVSDGYLADGMVKVEDVLVSYAIGTLTGSVSGKQTARYSGFTIPVNTNYTTDSRYCDTTAVTRSFMLTEAMISVREGDTLELVVNRGGTEYYLYFTFSSDNFTTYA